MPEIEKPETDVQPDPADNLEAPEENEAPLLEPDGLPEPEAPRIHPLAPGGRRFERIYAEGKQAQRENEDLKNRLLQAEAKIDVLSGRSTAPEAKKEYSWAELETFILQGRITRADAEAHREEINTRNILKKVEDESATKTTLRNRQNVLAQTVQDYCALVPSIMAADSPDRQRLDEEYDTLASYQGLDPSKVDDTKRLELQAIALRNVYGSIDSLRRRSTPMKVETHQGLPGGNPPAPVTNKDQELLNKLTKPQITHYKKMMNSGRYPGGWKDVVAELKYVPKRRGR